MNKLCVWSTLVVCVAWVSSVALAQTSFTDYNDVHHVLAFLSDVLPAELKSSDLSVRRNAWPGWVVVHDRDIRERLLRGDEDTIVNWLLFGTSFSKQAAAFSDGLPTLVSRRIRDFISALASADREERTVFARRLLLGQGYKLDTPEERARLEGHLWAEIERVIAERRQYMLREDAFPKGDTVEQIMVQSTLFRDRGLSLDTSILASFAIEQALEKMSSDHLLPPGRIRRVALIGPGLDFADKNSGYDFYPVQTVQPFTSIDSLLRLGLAAGPDEIELTTLDISPRVNNHIIDIGNRAKTGAPYILRLPTEAGSPWTPGLISYWKRVGDQIGAVTPAPRPPDMVKGIEVRAIEVRPQIVSRITSADFNVVTEAWKGTPFDLVIATNVLVYYDSLDQALAFAGIESMLRPGGFFLTNNVVVELPVSRLRSVGIVTVQHSAEKVDHVFWYRRSQE